MLLCPPPSHSFCSFFVFSIDAMVVISIGPNFEMALIPNKPWFFPENVTYFGLYGSDFWHDVTIDLDIRSYQNDVRHNNIVKEVNKIIKDKIRGIDDYTDIRIIASYSRSHYMRNMFNHIVTVSLRKLNPS